MTKQTFLQIFVHFADEPFIAKAYEVAFLQSFF